MADKRRSGKRFIRPVFSVLLLGALMMLLSFSVSAAGVTVYEGVDYSPVYDFDYYVAHNSYVKKNFADSPKKALAYFVTKGMEKRQRASEGFDVVSYINGCKSLRRSYKNNYKKYYLHYIHTGCKDATYVAKATAGLKKMQDYCVKYAGVSYAKVYDYNYYVAHCADVLAKYGVDDVAVFEDFVERGMALGLQGNSKFNVNSYMLANPSLLKKWGNDYEKYYTYYAKTGKGKLSDPDAAYTLIDEDEENKSSTSTTGVTKKKLGYTSRKYANATINGKKTLKTYLQNALVPCGRTLYIWGGGWGDDDASIIGYQKSWQTFFKEHHYSDYDYTGYRYQYGDGLDCSGFAAWTLYNTLYTKSGGAWLVYQSTTVAQKYADKGWATLSTYSESQTYKPGDVVSMSGHVWISLGECSDGSVLLVHSSPKGCQISGTAGRAASLAAHYMKKYFPEWPYEARTVSSGYLNYVGKARWKVTGSGRILSDPDGLQKMTADQVMKVLLGS